MAPRYGTVRRSSDGPTLSRLPGLRSRRIVFGGLVALTTFVGAGMMVGIVRAGGLTALELVLLAAFLPTFAWISVAFWNAIVGFVLQLLVRDPLTLARPPAVDPEPGPLSSTTAVLMPAYHEDPRRLVRGLGAVARSLAATGQGDRFALFLLSDTTDPDRVPGEEAAVRVLMDDLDAVDGAPPLYYRRRPDNEGRKAGNIQDWCRRWGTRYDFMAVLDADSVMAGEALVSLAATLERHPDAGLLQTVPLPARQETLFGRLLQFAGALYSPLLSVGQAFWSGDAGNYWGHNALLRVEAFMDHGRLPVLPGRPPLGGPILSHDFVEAALLRRGGWTGYLLTDVGGSFEEVPGNVVDFARRDRRWAQGSLQHLRLLGAPGLHPVNRLHLLLGAMGYLSSLFWLVLLLASTAYVAFPLLSEDPLVSAPHRWLGLGAGLVEVVSLLAVTAVLLFLPKGLGLLLAFVRRPQAFGGRLRLLVGAFLEWTFSVVLAPVMMMYHSAFVLQILARRTVNWEAQNRDGRRVAWGEAIRRTAAMTVLGGMWAGFTWAVSPLFFLWLTPIFLGLVLAAPLVHGSSLEGPARWLRDRGLLLAPHDVERPGELQERSAAGTAVVARGPTGTGDGAFSRVPEEVPRAMPIQTL